MTGSNITTFDIYSNYNKPPESISNAIAVLFYYESLLDSTVRVTASFADTGNREKGGDTASLLEQLGSNVNAGEKVELVLEDENGQKISLKGDYALRVKQIKNIIEDTLKSTFTIDFFSKECIDNEFVETRVEKRYDGKITDSVEKILKKDCLKTPKNIEIDPGLNDFNFIGNTEKPLYKLVWLAKRCVPEIPNANGNLAGYFFYEIGDNGSGNGGYKFKSIDKLFQQKPVRKMIMNNTTGLPVGYDTKILEYSFDSTVDIESSARNGSLFPTELRNFDFYQFQYKGEGENQFYPSAQFETDNIAGLEQINLGDWGGKSTRINFKFKDIGDLPPGRTTEDQFKNAKTENFNIDDIIRQSSNRYNNLFNVKLSIAIFGDFGLHVGDLVHCDFPEVSSKNNTEISSKKSGLYMIMDLCHYISPTGPTYTRLNLVRDSIGRKPMKF